MSEVEHKLSKARGRQRRALGAMAGIVAAIVLGAVVGAAVMHFAGRLSGGSRSASRRPRPR